MAHGFEKLEQEKDYRCRNCNTFLDLEDMLPNTTCPECGSNEHIFQNELLEEEEEWEDEYDDEDC